MIQVDVKTPLFHVLQNVGNITWHNIDQMAPLAIRGQHSTTHPSWRQSTLDDSPAIRSKQVNELK